MPDYLITIRVPSRTLAAAESAAAALANRRKGASVESIIGADAEGWNPSDPSVAPDDGISRVYVLPPRRPDALARLEAAVAAADA